MYLEILYCWGYWHSKTYFIIQSQGGNLMLRFKSSAIVLPNSFKEILTNKGHLYSEWSN